jgi:hypothetical protein
MRARFHHTLSGLLGAALLGGLGAPAFGAGAGATVTINVTILEVQCTAAQKLRIRACANAQESLATVPSKQLVDARSTPSPSRATEPRYELRVDPGRQAVVRTLLY